MRNRVQVRASYHEDGGAYASGQDQNLPVDIERLPFDLWRSHKYPRDPEMVRRATDRYLEHRPNPEMLLPQRMGFTRWKTPPWRQAYGSNVVALVDAITRPQEFRARLQAVARQGAPEQTMRQASLERMRLPQPTDNMSPEIDSTEVLPRNVLPQYRVSMRTPELEHVAEEHRRQATANDAQKLLARDRAMMETGELTAATEALYASQGGENVVPWFMQVPV